MRCWQQWLLRHNAVWFGANVPTFSKSRLPPPHFTPSFYPQDGSNRFLWNASAILTKYMASHLHHSFQISEWYPEGTITCPTHPLQVTTIFSGLFATTLSLQLTQNCKMCRNTACDAMCLSHILLLHFHLNCVSSISYSAEKCWQI